MRYLITLCAVLLLAASCSDDNPNSPGASSGGSGSGGSVTEINGTKIDSKTTLCGLISDAVSGAGIPDVMVSDGFNCVLTDANGVYQLVRDSRATQVFYSTPAEYEVYRSLQNGLPYFYRTINDRNPVFRQDFRLTRLAGGKETKFTLFCLADPQTSAGNVYRFVDETLPDVESTAKKNPNVYAMTLGDITDNNRKDVWEKMKEAMSNRSVAFFQTIGNHDHLNELNSSVATTYWKSIENFQNTFGPQNYSFNRGDVHIISMDNVLHGEQAEAGRTEEFACGFYDWQYEWLKQDLAYVPKDKMVILCAHVPFRNGGAGDHSKSRYHTETLNLLAGFAEAHLMIGHTHYNENKVHTVNGKKIYEHIHGAVCGQFWRASFNADGAPNGYGIYEIDGAHITDWYYKATGKNRDFQIRAYDGEQTYSHPRMNENGLPLSGKYAPYCFKEKYGSILTGNLPSNSVVANVWNRDSDWTISLWQRGAKVGDMKPFLNKQDLWVAYWFYEVYGCGWNSISTARDHLFYLQLKYPGEAFEVLAEDGRGRTYKVTEFTRDYEGVRYDFVMKDR